MEGNIVGEQFDEFVRNQIKIRQSNQFGGYNTSRTNSQLQYLNNRNAWVKLASSVDVLEGNTITPFKKLRDIGIPDTQVGDYSGNKFAAKAILFNTLSSFDLNSKSYSPRRAGVSNTTDLWNNFAYGLGGTNYGIQPPPGIISVQVDSLNRGSIRKANVTLKAHNRFQFDIIELLYLRLGFTMMLEWGWDRYLDNATGVIKPVETTIIEDIWFTAKNKSQLEMLGYIQDTRKKYDGNYDGFFGKVSNFTWEFKIDGSYDITIDLITVGDVIESIKANTFAKGKFKAVTSTEKELKDEATKVSLSPDNIILKSAALSSIGEYLYDKIKELNESGSITPTTIATVRLKKIENIVEYCEISPPPTNGKAGSQYYVRLGEFLAQLEGLIIPRVENGTSKTPQININYTTENSLCSYFPNQISLDPKICIFKPFIGYYGDINGVIVPFYLDSLETYVNTITTNGKIQTFGNLMNIYINIEYIAGLITSNGSPVQDLPILKLLQDLCNGINDALGGVNKLEPVIKNDNITVLIDQTLINPEQDIVQLEVYGYNTSTTNPSSNFVKDIKFVSKITPQLASMISIGATAAGSNTSEIDGTAFSKWSEGLVDRFSQKIIEPKFEDPTTTPSILRTTLENEWNGFRDANLFERLFRGAISGQKIVDNYIYGAINGQPMGKERFITVASFILRNNAKNGIWSVEQLPRLVSENYAVYLVEAFGGALKDVFIYSSSSPNKALPFSVAEKDAKYLRYNDSFIDQGKGAYKNYLNSLNNERFNVDNIPSSEAGFIPLSFETVLEGISGIKIYNKLSINNTFLPTNYSSSLNFVITKVNHQISNNNWDTSLSTISMPNTEPYPLNRFLSSGGSSGGTGNTGNTGGGNTGGGNSGNTTSYPVFTSRGPQPGQQGSLQLLKDLIGLRETSSTSNYGIANRNENALRSTTNVENLTFDELLRLSKLPDNQQNLNRVFAAGKFQVIPSTLEDIKKSFGFGGTDKFTKENQEKIGDYLLLNGSTSRAFGLGRYLRGDNVGNEKDLEDAIQAVGQIWASFPIIYDPSKNKVGFVVTGDGNTAYYGGSGANPKTVKLTIQDIVKYMIQTRINYSSKLPSFIPTYY